MADYKLLGKNYTTPDLVAKVTGQAKYAEDYRAEGMLFAKLMLSPRPHARITRIDIERVETTFDGASFGNTGPYEKLIGKAYGELDPAHELNRNVVLLDKAPRNAAGRVEYSVDVLILKPVDMSREELFAIWLEEARAAQGAVDAGAVTNLWKVVGQRSVFAVLDVPDHTSLDQAIESLPIIQQLGSSVDTRAYPIRPYSEWAEELRVAVEGE